MTSSQQSSGDVYPVRNTLRDYGFVLLLYGIGFLMVMLSISLQGSRQRQRVDELWKEYDTHVKYCGCMTREYDIDRDGGGK